MDWEVNKIQDQGDIGNCGIQLSILEQEEYA